MQVLYNDLRCGFVDGCLAEEGREFFLGRFLYVRFMTKVVHGSHVHPSWPPHSGSVTGMAKGEWRLRAYN